MFFFFVDCGGGNVWRFFFVTDVSILCVGAACFSWWFACLGSTTAEASRCRSCLGVDIDNALIRKARQAAKKVVMDMIQDEMSREQEYPISLSEYPNFHVPPSMRFLELHRAHKTEFPFTVRFRTENFVDPIQVEEIFDTALCLSTTKWVHLNWGDQGIKDLFARVAQQVRVGGIFILVRMLTVCRESMSPVFLMSAH